MVYLIELKNQNEGTTFSFQQKLDFAKTVTFTSLIILNNEFAFPFRNKSDCYQCTISDFSNIVEKKSLLLSLHFDFYRLK